MNKQTKTWRPLPSYEIKGEVYTVRVTKRGLPKGAVGYCLLDDNKILIRPDLSEREMKITLLHELFHALVSELHLESSSLSDDVEEILADAFATLVVDQKL